MSFNLLLMVVLTLLDKENVDSLDGGYVPGFR